MPSRSVGSGLIEKVPASIRVASRRLLIRLRIRSVCSLMIRKNCCVSAGSSGAWRAKHRSRGAFDSGEGRQQFVVHHAEKLSSQPFRVLQRRHVLHGNDNGHDVPLVGVDRSGIYESGHRPSIGQVDDNLLGTHRLHRFSIPGQETTQRGISRVHPRAGKLSH